MVNKYLVTAVLAGSAGALGTAAYRKHKKNETIKKRLREAFSVPGPKYTYTHTDVKTGKKQDLTMDELMKKYSSHNKYLEKIAALSSVAKVYARSIAGRVAGNTTKINQVHNVAAGAVRKNMQGVMTSSEKFNAMQGFSRDAAKSVGPGKLYPHEATRAAAVGSRLARMQAKKVA